jgi:DNA polymerase III subunit epsilon
MNFVAIDFETANAQRGSICQIGMAVVKDWQIESAHSYLVRPKDNWFDYYNTRLHGIDARKVEREPEFDVVFKELIPLLEGGLVLAHNAQFDISVLRHALDQYGMEYPDFTYSCTYQIAKRIWKDELNYRLDNLCSRFGIPLQHHHAKEDAIACAKLALLAFKEYEIKDQVDIESKFGSRLGRLFPGGYHPVSMSRRLDPIDLDPSLQDPGNIFYGKNVVFTGTLQSMVRREAQQKVIEIGGYCQNSITRDTNFLVVGDLEYRFGEDFKSSKIKKAENYLALGQAIELITEQQFLEMID